MHILFSLHALHLLCILQDKIFGEREIESEGINNYIIWPIVSVKTSIAYLTKWDVGRNAVLRDSFS